MAAPSACDRPRIQSDAVTPLVPGFGVRASRTKLVPR
jgi:hypothetical protein